MGLCTPVTAWTKRNGDDNIFWTIACIQKGIPIIHFDVECFTDHKNTLKEWDDYATEYFTVNYIRSPTDLDAWP